MALKPNLCFEQSYDHIKLSINRLYCASVLHPPPIHPPPATTGLQEPSPPALTALLAVLDPIAIQLSGAHTVWSSPLQRDGGVTDVIHTQANRLAGGS